MGCSPLNKKENFNFISTASLNKINNNNNQSELNEENKSKLLLKNNKIYSSNNENKFIRIYSYKLNSSNVLKSTATLTTTTPFNIEKVLKTEIENNNNDNNNNNLNVNNNNNIIDSSIKEENESKNSSQKNNFSQKILSNDEINLIKISLLNNYLFKNINENLIEKIIPKFFSLIIDKNEIVYKKGQKGFFFFIVRSGKFKILNNLIKESNENNNNNNENNSNENNNNFLQIYDTFGEDILCFNSIRKNSVKCLNAGELFFLDCQTLKEFLLNINKNNLNEKKNYLNSTLLSNIFNENEKEFLSEKMIKCSFNENKIIIRKNEKIDSLILLKNSNKIFDEINFFGKKINFILCYVCNLNFDFDVISKKKTFFYQIFNSDIINKFESEKKFKEKILKFFFTKILLKTNYFKYFYSENLDNIYNKIFEISFVKNYKNFQIVFEKNSLVKKLIFILNGNVFYESNTQINYKKYDLLCEENIINEIILKDNLIANDDLVTLEIKVDEIIKIFEISFKNIEKNFFSEINNNHINENITNINKSLSIKEIINCFERISNLKKIFFLKNLSQNKLFFLSLNLTNKYYKRNEILIQQNTPADFLYFFVKGKIEILSEKKKIIRIFENDPTILGEISLLLTTNHTSTVISLESNTKCYLLSKDFFDKIISKDFKSKLLQKIYYRINNNINLSDLFFVKKIGDGKYGHVSLVHNKNNFFAIKAVNKKIAIKKKILKKYFIKEKNFLIKLNHHFLISFVKTLQNKNYVFYLMEYINGFDLSYFLLFRDSNNNNNLSDDELTKKKLNQPNSKKFQTQFYMANILLVINYLQSKKICHRDIKLENIMLTTSGYLKLIDFNACTEITSFAKTITGTPYYMAPELLLGKGYGLKVDFWSLGVLAYKIYFGYFPFGNDLSDPTKIYDEIINKDVCLPNEIDCCYFGTFVKGLLNKNVDERLGSLNDVKKEKFFESFDWDEVDKMNMIPPFIPKERVDLNQNINKIDVKYENFLDSIKNEKLSSSIIDDDDKNLEELSNDYWGENF